MPSKKTPVKKITKTRKDKDGDITHLISKNGKAIPIKTAISQIKKGTAEYSTINSTDPNINVIEGKNKDYLRTNPDSTKKNNLDDLPNG